MSREFEIWDVEGHSDYLNRSWGDPKNRRGRHWEHMLSAGKLIRGKTVLDVACGMGHMFHLLMDMENIDYLGCDSSVEMLKKARGFFPDDKERFVEGDVFDLSNFGEVDSVIAVSLLMHLPDIEVPIRQMWSRAKKELIFSIRLDNKGFLSKRGYSGKTVLPEDKKLILRGEKPPYLYSIFGGLDEVFSVEQFFYDSRSSIFRLTRLRPRYYRGWNRDFKW